MEEKVSKYIRKHHMIETGDYVVAGISGGADSVCLLFMLKEFQKEADFFLEAVHVEHGIRGEESLKDAAFTKQLCKKWGITFHMAAFDVPKRAAGEKLTLEEAARKCRYEAFAEACKGREHAKIAVAHNQDDQAETILWNLVRGSGLQGLCGIRPVNGNIIRPLLGVSRQEIEAYLKKQGQDYCTDSTNLTDEYTRNRLRHRILPEMENGLNVRARVHIAQAGERLGRAWEYLEKEAKKKAEKISSVRKQEVWIEGKELLREEEVMQEYILRVCMERLGMGLKDVGAVHLDEMKKLAAGQSGRRMMLPGGRTARRTGDYLVLGEGEPPQKITEEVELLVPGESQWGKYRIKTSLEPGNGQIIPQKKYTKWLDYDTIKNTIQLRSRRSGDYFIAEGRHSKLKKYFINEKILKEERDKVLLLADESHILWIVGHRISEQCRVTQDTKTILKIQVREETNRGEQDSSIIVGGESE